MSLVIVAVAGIACLIFIVGLYKFAISAMEGIAEEE